MKNSIGLHQNGRKVVFDEKAKINDSRKGQNSPVFAEKRRFGRKPAIYPADCHKVTPYGQDF